MRAKPEALIPISGASGNAPEATASGRFGPTEPPGQGQETPPTVEYQATCEAYLADKKRAAGQRPDL
jgi:hypothetical protein